MRGSLPWHRMCDSFLVTMAGIRNKSILVVDDDQSMLRALEKVLRSEGAVVSLAEWADDAIEILTRRQKRIDLVITDLRMPLVTGVTLVYAIHKIFPDLPVIVLTAFSSPELEAVCREQGAAAYLEKPLDAPELLTAVRKALHVEPADGSNILASTTADEESKT